MKICHLSSVHSPEDIRILIKECQSLKNAGHEVIYIVPNATITEKYGVKIESVTSNAKNEIQRITKTTREVYKMALLQNADVYHFHDPELIPVGLTLRFKGKKVIYDVHEDVPRQILSKSWIKKPLRKLISWSFEWLENFAARRFNGVVTATPYINERFKNLGCNAVNVNNYPIYSELYLPEVDWDQKEKAVCYIGGLNQIRGANEMIEAMGKTNVKMFIGGNFSPKSLKEVLTQSEGWKNIVHLGFVDRKKVADTLSKSLAGIVLFHPLPNHINAQPNKMFEYMSAGIPVISSNFNLWKQIIEGNNCGLCVDPLKPDEIAKAIQWMADNPDKAREMGSNGRDAIENKYNWEKESEKLITLYQTLN
jgi:glycosyltransferase involved in cell wall biosynthesis